MGVVGLGSSIAVGEGATYGARATVFDKVIQMTGGSDSLEGLQEVVESENIEDQSIHTDDVQKGHVGVTGSVAHEWRFGGTNLAFLKYLMAHNAAPSGVGPHTSTFIPQSVLTDIDDKSLTLAKRTPNAGDDGTSWIFMDGIWVLAMKMSISSKAPLSVSWDVIGSEMFRAAAGSGDLAVSDSLIAVMPSGQTTNILDWGGDTTIKKYSVEVTITRNWQAERLDIEKYARCQPVFDGAIEVMASFEAEFDDNALLDDFLAFNTNDLTIQINDVADTEHTQILLRNATIMGTPKVTGRGPVTATWTCKAYHDSVDPVCQILIKTDGSDDDTIF